VPITTKSIPMQRNGSETSSRPGTSRQAKSIPAQLSMFGLENWRDIPSAISLPVSADGPMPCEWLDGPMIGQSGPDPAPASHSPSQAPSAALPTNDTSGRSGESLSASARLQSSLESRLRARLNGSDLCEVTWKPWNTPWGQCLSKPRARVRTISETDTGLWPTARASEAGPDFAKADRSKTGMALPAVAALSNWPTPTARDYRSESASDEFNEKRWAHPRGKPLSAMVWPTPTSLAPAKNGNNEAGNSAGLVAIRNHALATWVSPTAEDGRRGNKPPRPHDTGVPLSQQVVISNGSSAPTEKPGALNPEFVCWLMGYPPEWVNCAASEMPSTRARPPNSSVQP
jgi:hypothetical protein